MKAAPVSLRIRIVVVGGGGARSSFSLSLEGDVESVVAGIWIWKGEESPAAELLSI